MKNTDSITGLVIGFQGLKRGKIIKYSRPNGLNMLDVFLAKLYYDNFKIYGTLDVATDLDELRMNINHFKFLKKYNL